MPLSFEGKKALVAEVNGVASKAHSLIAAEYRGLSVAEMDELRRKARNDGVYLRVVKNTLARRALEGTDFECMREGLQGPLMLAFSLDDPGAAARVLKEFGRSHERLQVQLVAFGGRLMERSAVDRLASLPTRDQALAMLLGVMKAPLARLVRTMAEPQAKLARTLAAVREQKEAA